MSTPTPESIAATIARLKLLRHRLALQAKKPEPDGSLVPLLSASAECCALDVAVRVLETELRRVAS